jgi:hypothetical protein
MAMSISAVANGTERKTSNDYRAKPGKSKKVSAMTTTKKRSSKKFTKGGLLKKNWAKKSL